MMRRIIIAGCLFFAFLFLPRAVSAEPGALVAEGKNRLFTEKDVASAYEDFYAAWSENNSHPQANFWYGLTRVAVILQSDEMIAVLSNFGFTKKDGSPLDNNALNPFNLDIKLPLDAQGKVVLPNDSPTLTEVQQFFKNNFLAEIDLALSENFNLLDNTYTDTVDFGDGPIEVDYAEVLGCKTLLNFLSSLDHSFCAYDMDNVDIDELSSTLYITQFKINDLLNVYTSLFAPSADARLEIAAAGSSLEGMVNNALAAIDFIQSETDDQSDDFITLDANDPEINNKIQIVRNSLNLLLDSLKGPAIITIPGDEERFRFESYLNMDLSKFFDSGNPINLRSMIPSFTSENQFVRSSFPDPTIGGMFPDMTQADWNYIFGIRAKLNEPRVVWSDGSPSVELSWERESGTNFRCYRIYRTTTPSKPNSWTQIGSDILNPGTISFIDHTVNERDRVYYYKLYAYFTPESDAIYDVEKAAVVIYVDVNSTSAKEDGSRENPYKNLGGYDLFRRSNPGTKTRVATGTYNETIWGWRENKDGLSLEGGYDPSDWSRDVGRYPTIIDGSSILWSSLISLYEVSGLTIDGFTVTKATTDGINIQYSYSITIKNCLITENASDGISCYSSGALIENCIISKNNENGIKYSSPWQWMNASGNNRIKNNLISHNSGNGILVEQPINLSIENNTIIENGGRGGVQCSKGNLTIKNNIIIKNNSGPGRYGIWCGSDANPEISYNDVFGNDSGNYYGCLTGLNDISQDPLFVHGSGGLYYLSQTAAGQSQNSPCIDAGSDTALNLGLAQNYTTRTDERPETGQVDMGYHYPTKVTVNRPPVFASIGDKTVDEGRLLEFSVTATDADNNPLIYIAENLPSQATFVNQTFSWAPTYTQFGTYRVRFVVSDGQDSDSETITVTVNNVNGPPVFVPIGNKTVKRGKHLQFKVNALDPDGDKVTYDILNRPKGAFFLRKNGWFFWRPGVHQAGDFLVTFVATDKYGNKGFGTVTITVPNAAPVLKPIGNKTVNQGKRLQFDVGAVDPDGDRVTYNIVNKPAGANFNERTGRFSWKLKPTQAGDFIVTFIARDTCGAQDTQTITITVFN